jgi:hypothetical protein
MKDGIKHSDHNTLMMYMDISFIEKKQERIELFNFKNLEGQEKFFHLTETKTELMKCFHNENSIAEQSQQWFKNLNKYFHQSFQKNQEL